MNNNDWTSSTATSADGTTIAYETLGSGPGLIVVSGVLSTARNYIDLARELAGSFTVHLMERRGRGASGPQGPGYGVDEECKDLLAVQAQTGAQHLFGHSYGGLVALQTARRAAVFRRVAVYEPAVVLDGAPAPAWLDPYRELLAGGDTRGAFATMVKHAGFAPRALGAMPLAGVRLVLRAGIRGREWQRTEALLEANLAEQQAQLDVAGIAAYAEIESRTLLIGGSDSPPSVMAQLEALRHIIPTTTVTILHGLDHPAPQTHAAQVANCVWPFFADTPSERGPGSVEAARRPADLADLRR